MSQNGASINQFIESLSQRGYLLETDGQKLRVKHLKTLPLSESEKNYIKAKKQEIILCLTPAPSCFPSVCNESEKRYGHPAARLYPLLNKQVMTPVGEGILLQSLSADCCRVQLHGENYLRSFRVDEIKPSFNLN